METKLKGISFSFNTKATVMVQVDKPNPYKVKTMIAVDRFMSGLSEGDEKRERDREKWS